LVHISGIASELVMTFVRRTLLHFASAAALSPIIRSAFAQPYPVRPITIIVPLQAGTASDLVVRVLCEKVGTKLARQFVVENVVGAGGMIGAQRVAKSEPNGYTLGAFNNGIHAILPFSNPTLPFDPMKDFSPITMLAIIPSVLIVNPRLPAKNFQEFVALAKASPGRLTYASVAPGSPQHLAMEQLKADASIDLTHVPYRGGAQATLAIASDEVNAFWIATSVVLPFIQEGKVRALAVGGRTREAALPGVPTVAEAGVPDYEYLPWLGLFARAGTPSPVLDLLRKEFADALASPEVRERLASQGLEPRTSSPDELLALIAEERARMAPLIKRLGLVQQ
jgi:tripartite-type tricarboxylate transporter receptor subunit TctC